MKKAIFIPILMFLFSSNLFSQDSGVNSISLDPLTAIGLFAGSVFYPDYRIFDIRYIWFSADINWVTENQKEAGAGIIIRGNRVALTAKYRSFHNKETQSGFFWGLFGLIEWRSMSWYNDKDSGLTIDWISPFAGRNNVYHSIGITGGSHIGFRFRIGDFGITPYLGAGVPLFFCFGEFPPKNEIQNFYAVNILLRAVSIGLKFDFFYRSDPNGRIRVL